MSQQSLFQFLKLNSGNSSTTAFNCLDVSIFGNQPKCFTIESTWFMELALPTQLRPMHLS